MKPDLLLNEFDAYLAEMAAFCPFLRPALSQGNIKNIVLTFPQNTAMDIIESSYKPIYNSAVRVLMRDKVESYCENIILCFNCEFSGGDKYDNAILSILHDIIRNQFVETGIMVGKFWSGDASLGRGGLMMPKPPAPFISIRSAVPSLDERFLNHSPSLLQRFKNFSSGHPAPTPPPLDNVSVVAQNIITESRSLYSKSCSSEPTNLKNLH